MNCVCIYLRRSPPCTEQKTPTDKDGGASPKRNHCMKFKIDETSTTIVKTSMILSSHSISKVTSLFFVEVHVAVKELNLMRSMARSQLDLASHTRKLLVNKKVNRTFFTSSVIGYIYAWPICYIIYIQPKSWNPIIQNMHLIKQYFNNWVQFTSFTYNLT